MIGLVIRFYFRTVELPLSTTPRWVISPRPRLRRRCRWACHWVRCIRRRRRYPTMCCTESPTLIAGGRSWHISPALTVKRVSLGSLPGQPAWACSTSREWRLTSALRFLSPSNMSRHSVVGSSGASRTAPHRRVTLTIATGGQVVGCPSAVPEPRPGWRRRCWFSRVQSLILRRTTSWLSASFETL
jgi:hypothetical protein